MPPRGAPHADPDLATATPAGVQPEVDGWLLCLECGTWWRSLARHVQFHGMDAPSYRQAHGLRVRLPLVAVDIRRGHSQRAVQRIQDDPDAWRHDFAHPLAELQDYAAQGRASLEEARDRPGTRAGVRQGWAAAVRAKTARQAAEPDALAHAAGYPDMRAYLVAYEDQRADSLFPGADRDFVLGRPRPS
jgi:hypothetical protein